MQNTYNFEGGSGDDEFAFMNDFEMARIEGHVARIGTIIDPQKTSEIQETDPDFNPGVDISLGDEENALNTEEALNDLVQLEERHSEAERMKAVGNKHMAGQNYMEAYEAYTAALQLSPVGPSSHVFLSNRAAALLSLKKYHGAASDARRAIALAPTFGKAHARLGQALYFLKDYAAAIEAYEDAIHFEPDNDVTLTYLQKAKLKFAKQQQKKLRPKNDNNSIQNDLASSSSLAESTQFSVQNSIATDPYAHHGVIQKNQYFGAANTSPIVKAAALHPLTKSKEVALLDETRLTIGYSTVSVAASAMTTDSEEIQRLNNIGNISQNEQNSVIEEDHEFEEALRLQTKANKFLVQKQYRAAIEEYTAALFLVPDDQNLSPDLHLGRAHALNGSRRHESARNDALLAIKLNPTPAAFSTLAKSLFYMKEYAASTEAFETCRQLLPFGETLGLFDQAYLEKATNALNDDLSRAGKVDRHPAQNSPVPKLPPPRFVPRERALHSQPPALRPMPKQWPQQTTSSSPPLKCGHEREVIFLSEALGVKLNRGCDGIVRVLSVTQSAPGSAVARQGLIEKGDIVREAAGVDIRRPITNIMWGDTVALIKMAPRPISFLVSKELSPVPPAVLDEQNKKETEEIIHTFVRPSSASGDESLKTQLNQASSIEFVASNDVYAYSTLTSSPHEECETFEDDDIMEIKEIVTHDIVEVDTRDVLGSHQCSKFVLTLNDRKSDGFKYAPSNKVHEPVSISQSGILASDVNNELSDESGQQSKDLSEAISDIGHLSEILGSDLATQCITDINLEHKDSDDDDIVKVETSLLSNKPPQTYIPQQDFIEICQPIRTTLWEDELKMVGGSILFYSDKDATMHFGEWDTLRWLACSGQRKVSLCQKVYRQFDHEKKRSLVPSFWKSDRKRFENRALVIYQLPNLILILRRPVCMEEVCDLLGQDTLDPFNHNCDKYWIVESTIDPSHAKLRLSPLTTLTSLVDDAYDDRDRSCFQIISPLESVILSTVQISDVLNPKQGVSFKDSGAYLETLALETSIATTICAAQYVSKGNELELKHQIVIGTLHSLVISGNIKMLSEALNFARCQCNLEMNASLPAHIVDAVDGVGYPALYYACKHGMHRAIHELVTAGANKAFRIPPSNETLLHLVARNLDEQSLLILLSGNSTSQPDPNAMDSEFRTPMYVVATSISPSKASANLVALNRCLSILKTHGGGFGCSRETIRHPVSIASSLFSHDYLSVILEHIPFRYSFSGSEVHTFGTSMSLFYNYPVHFAILGLRDFHLNMGCNDACCKNCAITTLRTLFEHGFEPNERVESKKQSFNGSLEFGPFFGFAPIQVLAVVAMQVHELAKGDKMTFRNTQATIASVAEFMVRHGARFSISGQMNIPTVNLDSDQHIKSLFRGETRLDQALKEWSDSKNVEIPKLWSSFYYCNFLENVDSPVGSNAFSCAICWAPFGLIMNRKHKCRVTHRYVCDKCSSKRLKNLHDEYRVSDGQYLFCRFGIVGNRKRLPMVPNSNVKVSQCHQVFPTQARSDRTQEDDDQCRRESLFGGLFESASAFFLEGNATPSTVTGNNLVSSVSGNRDTLNQRGVKLVALNDKSAQLVEASADFAQVARELRRQSEKGLFW